MKKIFQSSKITIFTFLIIISATECKKDEEMPYVYVDIYLNLDLPQYISLKTVGNWLYITDGLKGIVVYHSIDGYVAFDRQCTYKPQGNCGPVEVDNTNIYATDSVCMSKFQITDGLVVNGPATKPLKRYNTSLNGAVLHIYN